jgi:hypothetical protein
MIVLIRSHTLGIGFVAGCLFAGSVAQFTSWITGG